MQEIWLPVKEYENYYEVSNLGHIRSLPRQTIYNNRKFQGKVLKPINGPGYFLVSLTIRPHKRLRYIHRLVAQSHISGYKDGLIVNHIDGNKHNNIATNLEWVTMLGNARHASRMGLLKSGIDNPNSVLNPEKVKYIRSNPDNLSLYRIAKNLGVSEGCVRHVAKNRTWKGAT